MRSRSLIVTLLDAYLLLTISLPLLVYSRCPETCSCSYDSHIRKTVMCNAAKLGPSIPISEMGKDTKVLVVSSAEDELGMLTVGPIFSPLPHLEEAHITRANVPSIGENSFWGLKHLKVLNLTENNITQVLESHLRGIPSLRHLHLDGNRISKIPSGTFMPLVNLQTLTLARNKLQGLTPRMFYLLKNLKTLDLSHNPIIDLDADVLGDISSLLTLRCSKCEIRRVRQCTYKSLSQLETLDLRENLISSLAPREYTDLSYLRYLYLNGNRIFELGDYVFRDKVLQHVGLSHNFIERILPLTFHKSTIHSINLSHNRLMSSSLLQLQPILRHCFSLNIGHNKVHINDVEEILKRATKLKKLNLASMHIHELNRKMFSCQTKLEKLNLSGNYLSYLHVDIFHSLPNLIDLDVSDNDIKGIPDIILRRLDRLKRVQINGNPWSCDECHIPDLRSWLNNSRIFRSACKPNIDAPNCIKCHSPVELYDKPIVETEALELQPCPEETFDILAASTGASEFSFILIIVTAAVVLLLLTVILIIGSITYNRHASFYYTNESEDARQFYNNPNVYSNHTDITVDEDPGNESSTNYTINGQLSNEAYVETHHRAPTEVSGEEFTADINRPELQPNGKNNELQDAADTTYEPRITSDLMSIPGCSHFQRATYYQNMLYGATLDKEPL